MQCYCTTVRKPRFQMVTAWDRGTKKAPADPQGRLFALISARALIVNLKSEFPVFEASFTQFFRAIFAHAVRDFVKRGLLGFPEDFHAPRADCYHRFYLLAPGFPGAFKMLKVYFREHHLKACVFASGRGDREHVTVNAKPDIIFRFELAVYEVKSILRVCRVVINQCLCVSHRLRLLVCVKVPLGGLGGESSSFSCFYCKYNRRESRRNHLPT